MAGKPNNLKTQTLICSVNNNILTVQTFSVVLDANYKWVPHVALKTANGDTNYQVAVRDDNGSYISNVHSAILEAGADTAIMDRFYDLRAINGKQTFSVDITRLAAVAVTGLVHIVFRLELNCPADK